MENYTIVFEHEILFRDLDPMGHVNNVKFVAFMEDARVKYWKALQDEFNLSSMNFILAEITCRFIAPAYFGEILLIGVRARQLGGKSFKFEYRFDNKATGKPVAKGKSAQVLYDYGQNRTIPFDSKTREAIAAIEKLPLDQLEKSKT